MTELEQARHEQEEEQRRRIDEERETLVRMTGEKGDRRHGERGARGGREERPARWRRFGLMNMHALPRSAWQARCHRTLWRCHHRFLAAPQVGACLSGWWLCVCGSGRLA